MINIVSLHHAHVQAADLPGNERFVQSFGLQQVAQIGQVRYYRTAGADAYSYVVEPGEKTRLIGLAFQVGSRADLEHTVSQLGAGPIRTLQGPGRGEGVTLFAPENIRIDLVHGIEQRSPDALHEPLIFNHPSDRRRFNSEPVYPKHGPASLLRLGHVGLFVKDFAAMAAWLCNTLGLMPTDRLYAGAPHNYIGGFYRLNRGEEFVDHHVIALFGMGKSEVHHLSFEVPDIEQQFFAHRHLQKEGWHSVWGVGRHPKGSHVFDVWKDPNGIRFETFTDTDLVNVHRPSEDLPVEKMEMDMWSNEPYHKYFA